MTILNNRAYYLVNHKYRSKVFYSINQNTLFGLHRPSWALASSQALIAYVAPVTGHLTFTMGDPCLTLTGTGAPRLVLAPDPRRNGGPDISDDYQYWKLVSMHDDSGKSGLQIQDVETGGWLEVTNSGTRVQCGMTEVGSETVWDLVLLPTPSALLQGLAGTGAASRGSSSRTSRPHGRRDDDEDTREDSESSVLEYSDDSCDDGWTIRADPVVRHRDSLAHQDITMRKC